MKIILNIKRSIKQWIYSKFIFIHTEIVYPKPENINNDSVEIRCSYPFNETKLFIPKEFIDNFEHRQNPDYTYLFVVEKQLLKRELVFRIHLVPPVKMSKEELDNIWDESQKEIEDLLDGAIEKK